MRERLDREITATAAQLPGQLRDCVQRHEARARACAVRDLDETAADWQAACAGGLSGEKKQEAVLQSCFTE
jgi:hypothetical protein